MRFRVEAEAVENRACARFGRMGVDIGKAGVDFRDAVRIARRLHLLQKRGALGVGGKNHVDKACFRARRFLRDLADAGLSTDRDGAGFGRDIAVDQLEQRGLALSVTPHEPHLRAVGDDGGGVVEKRASGNAVGEVVDMQHGGERLAKVGAGCKGKG